MGRYKIANPQPLVGLKYNAYQLAFLDALATRVCPKCNHQWKVQFGAVETLVCPVCALPGLRAYNQLLLRAGRQGGKTRIGTLGAVLELSFPGAYWWICGPTYRDLTDFVEPAFFAQIPQLWVDQGDWSASDRILTLPNKSIAAFRSLEDPESVRGPTLDGILMDETCKVARKAWEVAQPALAVKQGVGIFTTTPQGEDWVHEDLWLPAEQQVPGFWACTYKTSDNPIIPREFIEMKRRTMSPEMFRQEFEASIETFTGAIYGGLVDTCVVDDATDEGRNLLALLIPEWPEVSEARIGVVGLDPGTDHPFAGVFLVSTPRGMVAFADYEERNKPAMLHAHTLRGLAKGLQLRWGIDRSQAQMQIELAQHGLYTQPTENDVLAGIERVKSWMLSGQLFVVKSKCKRLIARLKSYRWAETKKNDGSTGKQEPYKRQDDLCLVADTLVSTAQGDKYICDLTPSDRVWTREGLKRVRAVACTSENVQTWIVSLSNGTQIAGTSNHPVWVKGRGFCPIKQLSPGDRIRPLCSTEQSGWRRAALSHRDITSTTKTGILTTIRSTIWSVCRQVLTQKLGGKSDLASPRSASSASVLSRILRGASRLVSARTTASQHGEGVITPMTSRRFASGVDDPSIETSTASLPPAQKSVVSVVAVHRSKRAPVFNLTVEDCHEFFANGVLVANCDALRYALMLWPHLPEMRKESGDRDLTTLPDRVQRDIERLRGFEREEEELVAAGMGEFYLGSDDDGELY